MAEFSDRAASGEGWLSLQIELLPAKFTDRAASGVYLVNGPHTFFPVAPNARDS